MIIYYGDENTKEIWEIQSRIDELIDKMYGSDEFINMCSEYQIWVRFSYEWDYDYEHIEKMKGDKYE